MVQKRKILVTGGAGYIGSHTVVELIENGFDVVIVDDLSASDGSLLDGIRKITGKNLEFFQVNCTNESELSAVFSAHKFDAVIHFAAFKSVGDSVKDPLSYYENNVGSVVTLSKVMKQFGVRDMVFSSSCTIYGEPDQIPVTEMSPIKPAQSPYGATKQMSERIFQDAQAVGLRTISLRYFNPIGAHASANIGELPAGSPNNLVPFITQTAAGIREQVTVFGNDYTTADGTCLRDYIHVVDLAKAHVKALEYLASKREDGLFEAFNIGTGIGVSVLQLIQLFEKITGQSLNYKFGDRRPGDVEKIYADASSAKEKLHWHATLSVEQALADAWRWEKKVRNIL